LTDVFQSRGLFIQEEQSNVVFSILIKWELFSFWCKSFSCLYCDT